MVETDPSLDLANASNGDLKASLWSRHRWGTIVGGGLIALVIGIWIGSQRLSPLERQLVGTWTSVIPAYQGTKVRVWTFSSDRKYWMKWYEYSSSEKKWLATDVNVVTMSGTWSIQEKTLVLQGNAPGLAKLKVSFAKLWSRLRGTLVSNPYTVQARLTPIDDETWQVEYVSPTQKTLSPAVHWKRGTIEDVGPPKVESIE